MPANSLAVCTTAQRLTVRQRKRWSEILLAWDAKNTYQVYDDQGRPALNVQEQGSGLLNALKRLVLAAMRPFTTHVDELATQRTALVLTKPWRWIFHRLEVSTFSGDYLGAVQRRWSWVRRCYDIEGPNGAIVARLFGPILRPWTFEIQLPSSPAEVGTIQKKWSGLGKEMFTQADNFGIDFGQVTDPALRTLLFSAVVLIDVVHFERSN